MTPEKQTDSLSGEHVDDIATRKPKNLSTSESHGKGPLTLHSTLGHHESLGWRAAEMRVVRKLDMTLLPTVWVLYMFNYLDRNNIAQVPFIISLRSI